MKRDNMTTEEVEKAAVLSARKCCYIDVQTYGRKQFIAGAEFADKHWQEKTRWKSLKTEPPKFNGEPFYITIKHGGSGIVAGRVISDKTIGYFIEDGFVEYKMI